MIDCVMRGRPDVLFLTSLNILLTVSYIHETEERKRATGGSWQGTHRWQWTKHVMVVWLSHYSLALFFLVLYALQNRIRIRSDHCETKVYLANTQTGNFDKCFTIQLKSACVSIVKLKPIRDTLPADQTKAHILLTQVCYNQLAKWTKAHTNLVKSTHVLDLFSPKKYHEHTPKFNKTEYTHDKYGQSKGHRNSK